MAHKTFISYKYSEATDLRDRIIKSLKKDASYYCGETSASPDLTDLKTETIKQQLSDMIWNTSVTIIILSPHMKSSKWIPWEIAFSLKNTTRKERTSKTNGIVAVIKKIDGEYSWFKNRNDDASVSFKMNLLPDIISKNHFNIKVKKRDHFDSLEDSYISFIEEDFFLSNPSRYIDNAFEKSQCEDSYNIWKIE